MDKHISRNGGGSGFRHRIGPILTHIALLILGVIFGVVLGPVLDQAWSWATWHISARTLPGSAQPDCQDPGWYEEIMPIEAHSYYYYQGDEPSFRDNYLATQTLDGDRTTAWVADFHGTDKDWIAWEFRGVASIELICIRNGYGKNYDTYAGNGRVLTAKVFGCERPFTVPFDDHVDLASRKLLEGWSKYSTIDVDCRAERIRLLPTDTAEAYDGSKLVSVSDVKFYQGWNTED